MPADGLAGALRECSLHSLLMLTSKALIRSGWTEVELLDRRDARQKSRSGGHEMSCVALLGPTPVKMIVKVVRDDVRTRMLDELAGAVLRNSADLGLIVTPYQVSASVSGKQAAYRPARVESLDGDSLATLMRCSGIAVRPDGTPDYAFLAELEAVSGRLLAFIRKEAT